MHRSVSLLFKGTRNVGQGYASVPISGKTVGRTRRRPEPGSVKRMLKGSKSHPCPVEPYTIAAPQAQCRAPAYLSSADDVKLRIHTIWKILPVPLITLERMPGRLVGLCVGPFIVVREDYASDHPTIVHELTHCKQFWRGFALLHLIRYYGSRRYRLESEVEAFRAELAACAPHERRKRLHESARSLATSYSLGLDTEACRVLLSGVSPQPRQHERRPENGYIESVPSLMPARLDRRQSRQDRRAPSRRGGSAQERRPEHNRRLQVDRRRGGHSQDHRGNVAVPT